MYINGDKLNPKQRAEVLRTFVHRWTIENARQTFGGRCPGCEQGFPSDWSRDDWHAYHVSLTTDDKWLADHAFYFIANGSRLAANRRYAVGAMREQP